MAKPKKNTTIWRNHDKFNARTSGRFTRTQSVRSVWKKAPEKGSQFLQTRFQAIFLYDSVPAGCIEKVVSTREDKIMYQRIPTPRTHPKVQHDKEVQQQSSTEQSCAEGDPCKIDLHVQGVPQNAVLQDQGRMTKIQDLVHALRTESQTESVITDLKWTGDFKMLSKECKNTIRSLGNIQLLELGEVFYENTVRIVWTGVLFETLRAFGATVLWDSCCSSSTQDHGAAGFVKAGGTQFFFCFLEIVQFSLS